MTTNYPQLHLQPQNLQQQAYQPYLYQSGLAAQTYIPPGVVQISQADFLRFKQAETDLAIHKPPDTDLFVTRQQMDVFVDDFVADLPLKFKKIFDHHFNRADLATWAVSNKADEFGVAMPVVLTLAQTDTVLLRFGDVKAALAFKLALSY